MNDDYKDIKRIARITSDNTLYHALDYINKTAKEAKAMQDNNSEIILDLEARIISVLQDRGWIETLSMDDYEIEITKAKNDLKKLESEKTSKYGTRQLALHTVSIHRAGKRLNQLLSYLPVKVGVGDKQKEIKGVVGLTEFGIENIKAYDKTGSFKIPLNTNGFPISDKQLYDILNAVRDKKLLVMGLVKKGEKEEEVRNGLYNLLNELGKSDQIVADSRVVEGLYSFGYIKGVKRILAGECERKINISKNSPLIKVSDGIIAAEKELKQKRNELELEIRELEGLIRQNGHYITRFELTKTGEAELERLQEQLERQLKEKYTK